MTISLLASCSVPDDVIPEVAPESVNHVAGITVVNERTGSEESFKPHYDESGRLFVMQHYRGEELFEEDTLHFKTGYVIIENRNHAANLKTFTELEIKDGLAVRRTVDGISDKLSYRDGFLVSDSRYNREFIWKNGDYANYYWDGNTSFNVSYRIRATYSWTAHKNMCAADELDPSFVYGGYSFYRYFGKRCAHLPAKVEYDYGEALPAFLELEDEADGSSRGSTFKKSFEYFYTFDDEGRVSKVKIIMKSEHFYVSYPEKSVSYTESGESASTVYIQYAQ